VSARGYARLEGGSALGILKEGLKIETCHFEKGIYESTTNGKFKNL
jgi:coenzyme F420-reducing hydrogenase delta subunit